MEMVSKSVRRKQRSREIIESGDSIPHATKQLEAANKHGTKKSSVVKAAARKTSDALQHRPASCNPSKYQGAQMSGFPGGWPADGAPSSPRDISLETLVGCDLPHPDSPTARFLVTEATGFEDPSPTFIREVFAQLSQQRAADSAKEAEQQDVPPLPRIIVERHRPGVNDSMAGAASAVHQPRRTAAELANLTRDDNYSTVCNDTLTYMNQYMPRFVFDRDAFADLNLFHLPQHINLLPLDFHVTMAGIRVAFMEIFGGNVPGEYEDHELLAQLQIVGGRPKKERIRILYPEDLVPLPDVPEEAWGELHRKYWEEIRGMAETEEQEEVADADETQ